ncbi:Bromodomain-containing protein [Daedaleopsis nitida]|nr:Bromodomain-containing protein [Daedaleopsis nitida]
MHDALSTNLNGVHLDSVSAPDSPAVDSVATPVNNSLVPDIKIDVDYQDQDSDVRHEPPPLKLDTLENASIVPQISTPVDPGTWQFVLDASTRVHVHQDSIPVAPPKGTPPPPPGELLEDVKMAEESADAPAADVEMSDTSGKANGLPNGQTHESPVATPVSPSLPAAVSSSETAVDSHAASSPYANNTNANNDDDDHDKPPPAKRARKYSDAERASLANTGTPPPASVSPPPTNGHVPEYTGPSTLSVGQWRFCASTVRTLKRMKDATPFINPVDPLALGIPHYPNIIKRPMDFSTIERKLNASNPTKPDSNSTNPRYLNADQFVQDVRLIFTNCVTFNGPDHPVTHMGKRVEAVFDKQIKQMPPPEEPKAPAPKKVATPPPPAPAPPKKQARRASTNVPVIRRNDESANVGRPKREIHPPPPKDLPYAEAPRKPRKAKVPKNAVAAEQLKFCEKLLKDLHQKQHYQIAHYFYEPVEPLKMGIPEYPKIVKKPMDLSTIKKKLDGGEFSSPERFRDDFRLMIKNCTTFNPPGNPVHEAGKALQLLFDEKWKNMPVPRANDGSDDDEEDEEEPSDDERARMEGMIADMESQIASMKNNLLSLKRTGKEKHHKEKKEKREKPTPPVASSSKPAPKQSKAPSAPKGKKSKKPVTDDDVLTFEQKKDLSDTISKLDGAKLERVIQIIHEGVPEIRESNEEIELEIDQLPAAVLTKLYNFVIRPMKPPVKRPRTGKGTGTGGLKRKSMDEDVETKKIRALEEKLKSFEQGGRSSGGGANGTAAAYMSEHSSAESSSDESSASDSE